MPSQKKDSKRKVYRRPGLRVLKLAAREVLAVGCKMNSSGLNTGVSPCIGGPCTVVDAS